jgi:hypothetical protein
VIALTSHALEVGAADSTEREQSGSRLEQLRDDASQLLELGLLMSHELTHRELCVDLEAEPEEVRDRVPSRGIQRSLDPDALAVLVLLIIVLRPTQSIDRLFADAVHLFDGVDRASPPAEVVARLETMPRAGGPGTVRRLVW